MADSLWTRHVRAIEALYKAAVAFTNDREHFAPGQYTGFIPLEGASHYEEHKALLDAAVEYARVSGEDV